MRLLHTNAPDRPATAAAAAPAAARPATSGRTRRGLHPAALLGLLALLTAVATGCTQDTHDPISPGIGNSDRDAAVIVLSAAVVTDGEGHGTVVGTVSNTTSDPDRLTDVAITTEHGEVPVMLPSDVPLGPEESVRLGETAGIAISSDKLEPGQLFELHLDFAHAGEVSLKVPVERQQDGYADVEIPT